MGFHNINEDLVKTKVDAIFDFLEKNGNPEGICGCTQCRTDVICYTLNRIEPHYIVSHRGAARIEQNTLKKQQQEADMVALIYEGIRQVNQRQRHYPAEDDRPLAGREPIFHIPIISGRLFNGLNFAPMEDVCIELYQGNTLVPMIDKNWQNPYSLVTQTLGVFTFWPSPLRAETIDLQKKIGFSIRVEKSSFEALEYGFEVTVISEIYRSMVFSIEQILRVPDLYMFPFEYGM